MIGFMNGSLWIRVSGVLTKNLVVGIFVLLRFLLLLGRNNLQKYAIICQVTEFLKENIITRKCLKNWLKLGILRQNKEGKYNDKSIIHLPRQHLPFPNGRIFIKRHRSKTWHRTPILHSICSYKHGRNMGNRRKSGSSWYKTETCRVWNILRR